MKIERSPVQEDEMPINNVIEDSIVSDHYCLASCPDCFGRCNKERNHSGTHYCFMNRHIWEDEENR